MTSKEALKYLLINSEELYTQYEEDEKFYLDAVELYNIVLKDLEILEILKNNLYEEKGTGRFKGCNTINCSLGNQHSGIDYTKVKEWLENGK